jgi:glycosyltransferase involved in cell wall biosynthesis
MTQRVVLVVGRTSGGTGAHVLILAAGLASRGIAASVVGPSSADVRFGFSALPRVAFAPVEFGDRPSPGDFAAVLRLRAVLRNGGPDPGTGPDAGTGPDPGTGPDAGVSGTLAEAPPVDVVHAHGLRAGAFSVLALAGVRGGRRPGLVVTVHNAPPASGGVAVLVYRLLERIVARGADLVLCVSPDLERRMRAAGARRVDRAVVPALDLPTPADGPGEACPARAGEVISRAADAAGRPIVLAVGRLAAQKGFGTLIEAAAGWRDLAPPPLVVIVGDGPLAADLRARAAALGVQVNFAGQRDDVPALLGAAAVFVLPSRWEGQSLVLQEALRAGSAIVATRAGGIPELTGEDAALLVPPDDPVRLAAAVTSVLTDNALARRLRAAAAARAAQLPSEADGVTAVLAAYATACATRLAERRNSGERPK